jgi:hypothetical protein
MGPRHRNRPKVSGEPVRQRLLQSPTRIRGSGKKEQARDRSRRIDHGDHAVRDGDRTEEAEPAEVLLDDRPGRTCAFENRTADDRDIAGDGVLSRPDARKLLLAPHERD